jgi:hypothetical protein
MAKGELPRISLSLIRAAEYFLPLHKFKGVEVVFGLIL